MIGRLSGILLEKTPPFVLIDVNGIGYECQAPMNTIYNLPELNARIILHTHLSVSENSHTLFAFYSLEERRLFRELIKVNGVGPKLALAILSAMSTIEFVHSIRAGEISSLVRIPGVGKKTAERLIIEMKDRLKEWHSEDSELKTSSQNHSVYVTNTNAQEAISGLIALGYKQTSANDAIKKLKQDDLSVATMIRMALKNIN